MKRIKYLYIVGVEGCGHHGLEAILEKAMALTVEASVDAPVFVYKPRRLRKWFTGCWIKRSPLIRFFLPLLVWFWMAPLRIKAFFGKEIVVLETNSFPFDDYRDVNLQWDLIELECLMSHHADVAFLAMHRDPIAAAWSHPDWDGGFLNHARVLRNHLVMLESQLSKVGTTETRNVSYEALSDDAASLVKPVARFFSLDESAVEVGMSAFRASRKNWREELDADLVAEVTEILGDDQSHHWKVFHDPKRALAG